MLPTPPSASASASASARAARSFRVRDGYPESFALFRDGGERSPRWRTWRVPLRLRRRGLQPPPSPPRCSGTAPTTSPNGARAVPRDAKFIRERRDGPFRLATREIRRRERSLRRASARLRVVGSRRRVSIRSSIICSTIAPRRALLSPPPPPRRPSPPPPPRTRRSAAAVSRDAASRVRSASATRRFMRCDVRGRPRRVNAPEWFFATSSAASARASRATRARASDARRAPRREMEEEEEEEEEGGLEEEASRIGVVPRRGARSPSRSRASPRECRRVTRGEGSEDAFAGSRRPSRAASPSSEDDARRLCSRRLPIPSSTRGLRLLPLRLPKSKLSASFARCRLSLRRLRLSLRRLRLSLRRLRLSLRAKASEKISGASVASKRARPRSFRRRWQKPTSRIGSRGGRWRRRRRARRSGPRVRGPARRVLRVARARHGGGRARRHRPSPRRRPRQRRNRMKVSGASVARASSRSSSWTRSRSSG